MSLLAMGRPTSRIANHMYQEVDQIKESYSSLQQLLEARLVNQCETINQYHTGRPPAPDACAGPRSLGIEGKERAPAARINRATKRSLSKTCVESKQTWENLVAQPIARMGKVCADGRRR